MSHYRSPLAIRPVTDTQMMGQIVECCVDDVGQIAGRAPACWDQSQCKCQDLAQPLKEWWCQAHPEWTTWKLMPPMSSSVLFLSRPGYEGWPHHGRTFSIYLYPLSFWLTLPQRVLSTTWCCLSRPFVVLLTCVHLALFLALFLSPGNSIVSSWCDHSMKNELLALTVSNSSLFTQALLRTHSFVFFAVHKTCRIFLSPFISKASGCVSSFFLSVQLSQPYVTTGHTSAFISLIFVEIGMLWLFHIFCSDAPIACPPLNLVRNSVVHSPSSVIRGPRYGNVLTCASCSFFILNEYATRYAVARHYFGLVDIDE